MPFKSGFSTVDGRINLVQEERFRLIAGTGKAYLLVLAHDSGVSSDDLRRWHRSGSWIRVEYAGEPNTENAVAHRAGPIEQR